MYFIEKNIIKILLVISVFIFFGFGFFHITKFETVDEHFWKYERIPQYWKEGILKQNWKKTYINDKPGVSTAIISGIGLLFEPNPETHRIRDEKITENNSYTVYDESRTEKINLSLRLPLLVFNSLSLFFFFWILRKIFDNEWLALITVIGIATSPILIGISQIINPDTLLWTFSSASLFCYFALIKTEEKKFLYLTMFFTGLGLLSKYTANLLFALYPLFFFIHLFFNLSNIFNLKKYLLKNIAYFFVIFIGSAIIFSLFLPAVFIKSKYFFYGTINSPTLQAIQIPIVISFAFLLLDTLIFKNFIVRKIALVFNQQRKLIFVTASLIVLFLLFFSLINSWSGEKFISLENIKENSYVEGDLSFPTLSGDNFISQIAKKMTIQAYPLLYTLLPSTIILIVFILIKSIGKNGAHQYQEYFLFIIITIPLYLWGMTASGVFMTPRYAIILFPLLAFLTAISTNEISVILQNKIKNIFLWISLIIIFTGVFSLWQIKPFYLNYMSLFLPKNQVITDSWGYGEYEAAEYLNSLPNPEKLVIWSDRSAICQFIKGKCIRDYKIDLQKTKPDYFVISRRGSIRHQFQWKNPELAPKNASTYYQEDLENPAWSLFIGNRPENFVKIIKTNL